MRHHEKHAVGIAMHQIGHRRVIVFGQRVFQATGVFKLLNIRDHLSI